MLLRWLFKSISVLGRKNLICITIISLLLASLAYYVVQTRIQALVISEAKSKISLISTKLHTEIEKSISNNISYKEVEESYISAIKILSDVSKYEKKVDIYKSKINSLLKSKKECIPSSNGGLNSENNVSFGVSHIVNDTIDILRGM